MSSTLVTMMLDDLTQTRRLKLRNSWPKPSSNDL